MISNHGSSFSWIPDIHSVASYIAMPDSSLTWKGALWASVSFASHLLSAIRQQRPPTTISTPLLLVFKHRLQQIRIPWVCIQGETGREQ